SEQRGPAEVAFAYRSLDGVPRETRVRFGPAPPTLSPNPAGVELHNGARPRRCMSMLVRCLRGSEPASATRFYATMRQARRSLAQRRAGLAKIETSNVTVHGILSRARRGLEMIKNAQPPARYPS